VISHLINDFLIIINKCIPAFIIIMSEGKKTKHKGYGAESVCMLYLVLRYFFSSLI